MHKVINRFVQTLRKNLMHTATMIFVHEIISGKPADRMVHYRTMIFLRIFSYIAVNRGGKQMPKSGLDKPLFKELTYDLQGIDGFLFRLCWEAVHQIRMHHDTCLAEIVAHLSRLTNGHPFIH